MQYRLLGPLEIVDGERHVSLGGARQRALLILLLLRRNQVMATEVIVEELWAGDEPRTAHQVVRVYVSQLRKALEPDRGDDEPRILLTRGAGYMLRTHPDEVDIDRLDALRADARRLVADGRPAEAAAVLREALALWRGPPLHDVAYESFAQHEVTRLEELRLVTLEDRFDAELAAGDDAAVVADLEPLVAANPLRERLRAQLMLALYRTGRQADALAAYADARRLLVEELGLEPAAWLSELQARILRHDPALERESPSTSPTQAAEPRRRRRMRWLGVAAASAVAVAAITIALVLRDGSSGHPANRRVTVIIGAAQQTNPPPVVALALDGAHAAERDFGADVHVVYGGVPGALDAHGIRSLLERVASLSGLVYTPFIASDEIIARVAREFPQTRFVVGYQVESAPYSGLGNVTGITFSDRELGYLAGYLGALMSHRGAVSVVGGAPVPVVLDLVEGFVEGAHAANPSIRVLRGYSGTFDDQSRCEALAKHQIDAGSRVIFNAAGNCGFGALEAAGIRGVWGIGVDKDLSYLGPHILASAVKRLDRATELGIKLFLDDALPRGRTVVLDLSTDSVGLVGINTRVSTSVRQELLQVAATLRRRDQQKASS